MRRSSRVLIKIIVAGCAVAVWSAIASAETVELRGGIAPVNADRVAFEPGGLRVTRSGGSTVLIAWDEVRGVSGVTLKESEKAQLQLAEDLWRARSRVQRRDLGMAMPLFEKHFPALRGTTSETALIAAEGLLRCRLASQDWMRAIVPALETARLRRAGISTNRYADNLPVLDDTTFLCPDLPPAWEVSEQTRAIASEIEALPDTDADVARVAQLYVALLRGEPVPPAAKRDEGGAALLAAIGAVSASRGSGDDERFSKARASALAASKNLPPWAFAWVQHAIGRARVGESDPAARIDGTLALLRVPALGAAECCNFALERGSALGVAERFHCADGKDKRFAHEPWRRGGRSIRPTPVPPATVSPTTPPAPGNP